MWRNQWWTNLQDLQVSPPDGQLWNQRKWRHLMTQFWTNASGVTWWPNFQLMTVAPPSGKNYNWCKLKAQYPGSVVPLAMFKPNLETFLCTHSSIFQWKSLHIVDIFLPNWKFQYGMGELCLIQDICQYNILSALFVLFFFGILSPNFVPHSSWGFWECKIVSQV